MPSYDSVLCSVHYRTHDAATSGGCANSWDDGRNHRPAAILLGAARHPTKTTRHVPSSAGLRPARRSNGMLGACGGAPCPAFGVTPTCSISTWAYLSVPCTCCGHRLSKPASAHLCAGDGSALRHRIVPNTAERLRPPHALANRAHGGSVPAGLVGGKASHLGRPGERRRVVCLDKPHLSRLACILGLGRSRVRHRSVVVAARRTGSSSNREGVPVKA